MLYFALLHYRYASMLKNLIATVLVFVASQALATTPWPLEIIDHLDDATLVVFVNEADIEASPKWNPDSGAPPFGLQQMFQAVAAWKDKNDCTDTVKIEKIELKPIAHHEKEGRWYYLVQLRDEGAEKPTKRYLAILMNGKAIAAVKEPESYK